MGTPPRAALRLALCLGVAGLLALGVASGARAQGLILTGYADLEGSVTGLGSDDRGVFFDNHHFNLNGIGNIVDNLFAAGEIDFEHGGAETALE